MLKLTPVIRKNSLSRPRQITTGPYWLQFGNELLQDEGLLRTGVSRGITRSIFSMEGVVAAIRALKKDAKETLFYEPFKNLPSDIDANAIHPLKEEAEIFITDTLIPTFLKVANYIEEEYLKACRKEESCQGLPNGKAYYRQLLKYHTSVECSPQEIHDLGLREVARIRAEMEEVIKKIGFEGSFREFTQHLRTDPKFYYDSSESIVEAFKDICDNQIRPKLPKLFNNIPKSALTVKPIPSSRAGGPMGYYLSGTLNGSRPGVFFVNTNKPQFCPKYEMMALSLHEGEPGHHFQFMYTIEKENGSAYRQYVEDMNYMHAPTRFEMYTAYAEGWGLYCEFLGRELGLYEDPHSLFGQLSYEMHRACRLVVDTGLHAFGWTYKQALQLCVENTAACEEEIDHEIRRYITWPGQACAYKIGQMQIQELREQASKELGSKFDVREYHEEVLRCLPVTMPVLEKIIQKYIDRVKSA